MTPGAPLTNAYTASALEIRRMDGLKAGGRTLASFSVSDVPYPEVLNPILASYYMPLALTGSAMYRTAYFSFLRLRMAWRRYFAAGVPRPAAARAALRPTGGRRRVLFLNFWENHYTQLFSSLETLPAYRDGFSTVLAGLRSREGDVQQLGVYDYFPGEAPEYKTAAAEGARALSDFERAALAEPGLTTEEKRIRAAYFKLLARSIFYEFPAFSDLWRSADALLAEVKPALVCAADFCDIRCRAFFLLARRRGIPTLVLQQGLVSEAQSEFFFPVTDRVALWDDDSLRLLAGIEETVLCLLLLAMIVLSCLQITLRGLFSGGLLWADPLIQQMVLWSGLLGAALATSRGKHISLDVITYLAPERLLPWILVLTHLFSALTTTALGYAACLFLQNEVTYSRPGLFGLPSWAWNAIFPLAFLIIALRYYLAFFRAIGQLRQPDRGGQR